MKKWMGFMAATALMASLPYHAQAAEKHLFYMNGCCINKVGSAGYETIIQSLKDSGFNVVFNLRTEDNDAAVQAEVARVADGVKALLAKGTAPEDITVSGYSLGAAQTLFVSIAVANPKVNYVLLAGCPGSKARAFDIDYAKVQGRVLAITDTKDDRFGSCKDRLPASVLQQEVTLDSGKGHPLFRLPDEASIKLWKEPLEAWAKGKP